MRSCLNQTHNFIAPQCAAQSVGTANHLFTNLIQTLLAVQCSVSPPQMWPHDYGKIALKQGLDEYDFIVIGAGTAGCIVAGRLSENPNWNVLLLEAGGDPPFESEVTGLFSSLQRTKVDWKFNAKSSKACQAQPAGCYCPRGKMLGGSSSINAMVYTRGNKLNYDYWATLGNFGWDYESILPYFKKSESNQYSPFVSYDNGKYHSASGPMKVDFFGDFIDTDKIFIDAALENGIPLIKDINADQTNGYVNLQGTTFNGRRESTAKAFLIPAKHRPNLHVIKNALVKKILINKRNRAYGVKFQYNNKILNVFARKEVILSAGTIMSPILLMLSGIGSQVELQKHNIPPKMFLNGVGKNLYDHPVLRLFFTFNPTKTQPAPQFDDFYQFAIHNKGSLVSTRNVGGFINSKNDSKYADIQFYQAYFTQNNSGFESYMKSERFNDEVLQQLLALNQNNDVAVVFIELQQPKSSGYIRLNGTRACQKSIIRPEYFSQNEDMETMLREVKRQISFTNSKSYQAHGGKFPWLPLKACQHFEMRSDAYLECYIKQFSVSAYHPVGTCKMGPKSDPEAVVDPFLRVYGIDALRVVDASVMPYIPSANTNTPTCMIAEKASDAIKIQHIT